MHRPLERWLVETLASLTLRKAVGLIVGIAATLSLIAALLERLIDPEEFNTFGTALWWAVTTVSTVGYGDYVPQNTAGRFVASVLMLIGLSLIPLITSVVVSILVSQRTKDAREQQTRDIEEVLRRLEGVDQRLTGLERR